MTNDEQTFLWDHFKFNADQRLKTFNFFVVLSVFADGWVLNALDKEASSVILGLVGCFIGVLAIIFLLIDERSKWLIELAMPGLKACEKNLPAHSRLFDIDDRIGPKVARYTYAFRMLFAMQFLFGIGIIGRAFGILRVAS